MPVELGEVGDAAAAEEGAKLSGEATMTLFRIKERGWCFFFLPVWRAGSREEREPEELMEQV